jgi:hypothetical protein
VEGSTVLVREENGLQLDSWCQPRTFSPGERAFKPAESPDMKIQGFSPGGGASNSILTDADDQADNSGLSLNPALPGFSQM